jgi:hypothetical protein
VEKASLCPGTYQVNIAFIENGVMQDYLAGALDFEVIPADFFRTGKLFSGEDANLAKVLFRHSWAAFD